MSGGVVARQRGGPENIQDAWRILAGGAQQCAEALLDVAQNSESDSARVAAAGTVLDRLGMGARPEVTVRVVPSEFDGAGAVDNGLTPGEIVRKRMLELAAATAAAVTLDQDDDGDIIEAVLVQDPS